MDAALDFQAAVAALELLPMDFDPQLFDLMLMCPECVVVRPKTEDDNQN